MGDADYPQILRDDPGDPAFAEYAEKLRDDNRLDEAMEICLAGLTANPGCLKGRLVLARVFYEKKYIPFCIRELKYLQKKLPDNRSLGKLIEKFVPAGQHGEKKDNKNNQVDNGGGLSEESSSDKIEDKSPSTVAEVEIDFDILDDLEGEES